MKHASPIPIAFLAAALVASPPASGEWFALVGDASGELTAVSLDRDDEPRPLGAMPRLGQMGWLAMPETTDRVYGFWSGGGITCFDLAAGTSQIANQQLLRYNHGSPMFSPDGRWLVLNASLAEGAGFGRTMMLDTSDWSVLKAWERYLISHTFAADSGGLYFFGDSGVDFFHFADGTTSIYCAIPGARQTFAALQMIAAPDSLVLMGYDHLPNSAGFLNGCPYRVKKDSFSPIQRLSGISGRPCPGNPVDGPYWFYDTDPLRVNIQVAPNQWDIANDGHSAYGIVYRLSADVTTVTTWDCSTEDLRDLLPDDPGLPDVRWPLSDIVVAPDGKHVLGVYDRGYRHPAYVLIGDAASGKWLRAHRMSDYGMTNVVFWDSGESPSK